MQSDVDRTAPCRFVFGPFELTPERQSLLCDGNPVRLGGRALDILTLLVERPGEIVSKGDLMARVWPSTLVEESNLKVNMSALRRTLALRPEAGPYIATVAGRGYRFVAPVHHHPGAAPPRPAPQTRRDNLPSLTTRIFGREAEIAAIRADLRATRIETIVGPGGVGKTTLATAVAEAALGDFRDGIWLVDLAALTDPLMLPLAVASAVGFRTSAADPLAALCLHLRDREMLLILDNCEHLIDAAADCAERIAARTRGVVLLATSREPLGVNGERVRRLEGLEVPPLAADLTAAQALTFPAVQLFADRATARLQSFRLNDAEAPFVARICQRLDGLALAIELAATRVDMFSVSALLGALDDGFRLLDGRRAGPERQRALIATLDWSFRLLAPEEAAMLSALAVFAGPFRQEDAAAVAQSPPDDTAEGLRQLAAKSLLAAELRPDGVTYRLLETTRVYCLERLAASGLRDAVQRRHATQICAVLDRATSEWPTTPAPDWGARYQSALPELRAALVWAGSATGDTALLVQLTAAGTPLWNHFSLTKECRLAVIRAIAGLDAAGLAGTRIEMKLQTFLAGASMFTHSLKVDTLAAAERAMQIAEALEDTDFYLRNLWLIGGYEVFTGQHSAAKAHMEAFRSVAGEKDPSALADGMTMLSLAEFYLGRISQVIARIEGHFQPDPAAPAGAQMARFLFETTSKFGVILGMFQWVAGHPDKAARTSEAVLNHTVKIGHEMTIVTALVVSAIPVALWSRHHDLARIRLEMLETLVERNDLETWRPVILCYRGLLASAEDPLSDEGITLLRQGISGLDAIRHRVRTPYFVGALAEALARCGRLAEAADAIAEALARCAAQGELWCRPELLRIEAAVLTLAGQRPEAEATLLRAIAMAAECGARGWQMRAAVDLAQLCLADKRPGAARAALLPLYRSFPAGQHSGDFLAAQAILDTLGA